MPTLSPITDDLAHKKTQALAFNHLLCTASSSQSWTKGEVISHLPWFFYTFFQIFVHVDIQRPPPCGQAWTFCWPPLPPPSCPRSCWMTPYSKLWFLNCVKSEKRILRIGNLSTVHVLLSRFYPDSIVILSRFYPNFMQSLSRFYPDFLRKFILSWFYPDSSLIFKTIWIKSG